MRLFIAQRTGSGAHGDPVRPDVDLAAAGGRLGSYELISGELLCCTPELNEAPPATTDLGDDPASAQICELLDGYAVIVAGVTLCPGGVPRGD